MFPVMCVQMRLGQNMLNGTLPDFTKKLTSLLELNLAYNTLSGTKHLLFGTVVDATYAPENYNFLCVDRWYALTVLMECRLL